MSSGRTSTNTCYALITSMLVATLLASACGPLERTSHLSETTSSLRIHLLTYNAFILAADRHSAKTLEQRLQLLPEALASTGCDIAILQEVWGESNQAHLRKAMNERGYDAHENEDHSLWPPYFYGNGLMIFLRRGFAPGLVARDAVFTEFETTLGYDRFTKKGLVQLALEIPGVGSLEVFNAHASFLPFDSRRNDFDRTEEAAFHRQIRQIRDRIRSSTARVKVIGIDTNTHAFAWKDGAYTDVPSTVQTILTSETGMIDPFDRVRPECYPDCYTWDNDNNELLRSGRFGEGSEGAYPNSRIDQLLVGGAGFQVHATGLAMQEEHELRYRETPFASEHVIQAPLSDHYGVLTTIDVAPR